MSDQVFFAWYALSWAVCVPLNYGMFVAWIMAIYQTRERQRAMFREQAGVALLFASLFGLFGPIGLIVVWLMTGFAEHGLMYRRPR